MPQPEKKFRYNLMVYDAHFVKLLSYALKLWKTRKMHKTSISSSTRLY